MNKSVKNQVESLQEFKDQADKLIEKTEAEIIKQLSIDPQEVSKCLATKQSK